MYRKKHSIYRVQYHPQFQASTGGLGTYVSPSNKGELVYLFVAGVINAFPNSQSIWAGTNVCK